MDPAERDGADERPAAIGDERRLTVRAYHRWTSLLGERSCPPGVAARELQALAEFSPHLIVLERRDAWIIRFLGERLAKACGGPSRRLLTDPPASSLLLAIAEACAQVLERNGPAEIEPCACDAGGPTVLYRGILLPFASEENAIEQVVAVVTWKSLPAEESGAILDGLFPEKQPRQPSGDARPEPLVSWADGPLAATNEGQGALTQRLRALPPVSMGDLAPLGGDFPLLLGRRGRDGQLTLLGEVPEDGALVAQAARLLLP